jgi:hypothetical protein
MTSTQSDQALPLIVQYLYLDEDGRTLPPHPSVRTSSPARYLECALTHAASLRLQEAQCDLVLATNLERRLLGRRERHLLDAVEHLGVQLLPTEFRHRPAAGTVAQASSRFVRDAVVSGTAGEPPDRPVWVPNLDCVWFRPDRAFAAAPPAGHVGCIVIPYPPDWPVAGEHVACTSPRAIGALAADMGVPSTVPPWLGADVLCGSADALRRLVATCEELDEQLHARGVVLESEQQVMSLANALDRISCHDLSGVARRIHTGSRHTGDRPEEPTALGLWHLPAEKGLSLRRAAVAVGRGRSARLRTDLADPERAARRFNLGGASLARRARDDGWLLARTISSRSFRAIR